MKKADKITAENDAQFYTGEMRDDFTDRLIKLREQKNISARKMSNALDCSQSYLNKVENGEMLPSMEKFFTICAYLGITPAEFFSEDIKNPNRQNELLNLFNELDDENAEMILSLCRKLAKSQKLK